MHIADNFVTGLTDNVVFELVQQFSKFFQNREITIQD